MVIDVGRRTTLKGTGLGRVDDTLTGKEEAAFQRIDPLIEDEEDEKRRGQRGSLMKRKQDVCCDKKQKKKGVTVHQNSVAKEDGMPSQQKDGAKGSQ